MAEKSCGRREKEERRIGEQRKRKQKQCEENCLKQDERIEGE